MATDLGLAPRSKGDAAFTLAGLIPAQRPVPIPAAKTIEDLAAPARALPELPEFALTAPIGSTPVPARLAQALPEDPSTLFAPSVWQDAVWHDAPAAPMHRSWPRRVGGWALNAVVLLAVMLLLGLAVGPRTGLYRTQTILTGSMAPTLPIGAVLIYTPEPLSAVAPGQVITYRAPLPGAPVITHRVVWAKTSGAAIEVQTKGDANLHQDPWVARMDRGPVWRVRASVPVLGTLIGKARQPMTLRVLLYGLPALLLLGVLRAIWRSPSP